MIPEHVLTMESEAQTHSFCKLNNWLLTQCCHNTKTDPLAPSLVSFRIKMQQGFNMNSTHPAQNNPNQALLWGEKKLCYVERVRLMSLFNSTGSRLLLQVSYGEM